MNLTKNRNRLVKIFKVLPCKTFIISLLNSFRNRRLRSLKTPENLIFFVTNRCNARCAHCFLWKCLNKEQEKELTLSGIEFIVRSLKHRLDTLLVSGGEPLLREDLYDLLNLFYAYNHTKKFHIPSNGSLPEKLNLLCEKILNSMDVELSVIISIDGDESYHNKLRGTDIYQKAVRSLKLLRELESSHKNFVLTAITTLTTDNVKYLPSIAKAMSDIGVRHGINLCRGSTYGIMDLDAEHIADYDPREKMSIPSTDELIQIWNEHGHSRHELGQAIQQAMRKFTISILKNKKPPLKCRAGAADGVLYPDGAVSMCEMTKRFANVKDYNCDFHKLWHSEPAETARSWISKCSCIHPCHMINSMKYDYSFFNELTKYNED
ncbi:radical SAM protein [Verrucomicrobiota bacterium]